MKCPPCKMDINQASLVSCAPVHLLFFRYGVSGYPTLKFFPKGNKGGEDYDGDRDLDDFVKFLNEKCGTSRDANGQLTSQVMGDRS